MKTTKLLAAFLLAISLGNANAQYWMPQNGILGPYNICGGAFYDSQTDPGANYGSNQNGQLVICPAIPGQFSGVTFNSVVLNDAGDVLRIYSGVGTGGLLLQTFQGPVNTSSFCGTVISQDTSAGCLTFQFISDAGPGVAAGWTANIFCSPTASTFPPGSTCANPDVIVSLPYSVLQATTCCLLNDYYAQSGICNATYAGEDRVYSYTASGPQLVCITMPNATGNPALAIYQGCPGAGGVCLTPIPLVGNFIMTFTFPAAGTYYIIVDVQSGCANYDLDISICTGIEESISYNIFSISPNPSSGKFILDNYGTSSQIIITNILGEKIFEQSRIRGTGKTEINLSGQPAGIYFVQMKNEKKTAAKKIVIQK